MNILIISYCRVNIENTHTYIYIIYYILYIYIYYIIMYYIIPEDELLDLSVVYIRHNLVYHPIILS